MKIIISGGGTGGHIYPAIAIANALKQKIEDVDILFIGAKDRMEMEKVPIAGYKIKGLWISGLQRRITFKNLLFPIKVISSLFQARKIIDNFKPDVVVGVGGYASGPTLRAATYKGIPTLIQEQNSFPGITNKMLAAKVTKICVAYDGMEKFFPKDKIILTGNPVRQNIIDITITREQAADFFGNDAAKKTVLVIGGSLGARTINETIEKMVQKFVDTDVQLIWQTGKYYFSKAQLTTSRFKKEGIKSYDFINQMDYAYAAADVIISRAGAIAISELCIVGKPVILIPSPNVAEDHQTKNAMALVNRNAAILVRDIDAEANLSENLFNLLSNNDLQKNLSTNIKEMAYLDATQKIADVVIEIANK
ncbi:MAG: undecaprenyldiphospho-muramoylpentapeptide beta-N-acetylglucosaminyltransferase [Bacteroidetes bacterium]|nr:undecaprenyldiphospho-muramoylpentapeptide beta-N-acetylglucosaminyltransferase [Bacteroidota bacterium]